MTISFHLPRGNKKTFVPFAHEGIPGTSQLPVNPIPCFASRTHSGQLLRTSRFRRFGGHPGGISPLA